MASRGLVMEAADADAAPATPYGLFSTGLFASPTDESEEEITDEPAGEWSLADEATFSLATWSSRARPPGRPVESAPCRGRFVRAAPLTGHPVDLAWEAMVRESAFSCTGAGSGVSLPFEPRRWLRKVRHRKPGRLLLFLVDLSGSMGTRSMELARETASLLLEDAYVTRDRVAVVAFRGRRSVQLFAPTNQAETVQQSLRGLECGGRTPLADGLRTAGATIRRCLARDRHLQPVLAIISDGHGNYGRGSTYAALTREVEHEAGALATTRGLLSLLMDTTEPGKDDSGARRLARALSAPRFHLAGLAERGIDPALHVATRLKAMRSVASPGASSLPL